MIWQRPPHQQASGAKVDAGTEKTPGFKFSFWEMKACCCSSPILATCT